MVLSTGIEPVLDYSKRILSPQRLPVPPREHKAVVQIFSDYAMLRMRDMCLYTFACRGGNNRAAQTVDHTTYIIGGVMYQ